MKTRISSLLLAASRCLPCVTPLTIALATEPPSNPPAEADDADSIRLDVLSDKAHRDGLVSVIVRLRGAFAPDGGLRQNGSATRQRAPISRTQTALLARLRGYDTHSIKRYQYIP